MYHSKTAVKELLLRSFILLFVVVHGPASGILFNGDGISRLKYTYGSGTLPSAFNGRIHDYSSPAVNTNARGGVGVNGVKRVTGRDVDITSKDLHDASLNGVGEVFVPKTFPHSSQEPSCEQLRAMWIFSKRQSRAAEVTNEIPTYRDPFSYNVWEPLYSSTRSLGSVRMSPRERSRTPVFGRVVSREPQRTFGLQGQRQRHFGPPILSGGENNSGFLFGGETRPSSPGGSLRRPYLSRYIGGANGSSSNLVGGVNQNSVPVQGSFEKLKELIWTERAKELTQQRRAEEIAARAAVLKEVANGQNVKSSYKPTNLKSDSPLMEENRSPDNEGNQYISDGRMSIARGQMQVAGNKNFHSNSVSRASTRSLFNRFAQQGHLVRNSAGQLGSIFSENKSSAQTGRSSRLKKPPNGSPTTEGRDFDEANGATIGIPRSYPLRQSHFRERNRSLFKQYTPSHIFQRDIRGWLNKKSTGPSSYWNQVLPHILEQYSIENEPSEKMNALSDFHSGEITGDGKWIYSGRFSNEYDNDPNKKHHIRENQERIRSEDYVYDYDLN